MSKLRGLLRYNETLRFHCVLEDGRRFSCSDYEQTICTRSELLRVFYFHVNENDEACDLDSETENVRELKETENE